MSRLLYSNKKSRERATLTPLIFFLDITALGRMGIPGIEDMILGGCRYPSVCRAQTSKANDHSSRTRTRWQYRNWSSYPCTCTTALVRSRSNLMDGKWKGTVAWDSSDISPRLT